MRYTLVCISWKESVIIRLAWIHERGKQGLEGYNGLRAVDMITSRDSDQVVGGITSFTK